VSFIGFVKSNAVVQEMLLKRAVAPLAKVESDRDIGEKSRVGSMASWKCMQRELHDAVDSSDCCSA
jgi:hypothetical protein